jgi:hypothetical protein
MKKIVIFSFILILGIYISYQIGLNKAIKLSDDDKRQIEQKTLYNNPIPECNYGHCPQFQSFDVNGDGKADTVGVVYTRMSQHAGQVWVISNSRVEFISEEKMFANVRPAEKHDQENGFIIDYAITTNPQSNDDLEHAYYKYEDSKYILEKIEKGLE